MIKKKIFWIILAQFLAFIVISGLVSNAYLTGKYQIETSQNDHVVLSYYQIIDSLSIAIYLIFFVSLIILNYLFFKTKS